MKTCMRLHHHVGENFLPVWKVNVGEIKKESVKAMENGSFHIISGYISRCSSLKVTSGVSDLRVEI